MDAFDWIFIFTMGVAVVGLLAPSSWCVGTSYEIPLIAAPNFDNVKYRDNEHLRRMNQIIIRGYNRYYGH